MMNIFFKLLCVILWSGTISNSFSIGIPSMAIPKLIIDSPTPNGFAKARAKHGIESVISLLIELQRMKEMLSPSLENDSIVV